MLTEKLKTLTPLVVYTEPQAKMFTRLDKESGIKRTWKVGDEYFEVYCGEGRKRIRPRWDESFLPRPRPRPRDELKS